MFPYEASSYYPHGVVPSSRSSPLPGGVSGGDAAFETPGLRSSIMQCLCVSTYRYIELYRYYVYIYIIDIVYTYIYIHIYTYLLSHESVFNRVYVTCSG